VIGRWNRAQAISYKRPIRCFLSPANAKELSKSISEAAAGEAKHFKSFEQFIETRRTKAN
jgi:hypothetical protein